MPGSQAAEAVPPGCALVRGGARAAGAPFPGCSSTVDRALAERPCSQEAALGASHPSVGSTLHNLAGLHLQQRNFPAAAAAYRSALARKEAALGRLHPEYAATLAQLAEVLRLQGRLADAAALLRESTDVLDSIGAGHTRPALLRLGRLAQVLAEAGRQSEAVAVHRRLVQAAEGGADALSARALVGLADALRHCSMGEAEAHSLYVRALGLAQEQQPLAAAVMRRLADAELDDGCARALDQAQELLRTALPHLHQAAEAGGADGAAAYELAAAHVAVVALRRRLGDQEGAAAAATEATRLLEAAQPGPGRDALRARLQRVVGRDGEPAGPQAGC